MVISNGVINLSPVKQKVFDEAARLLKPGGRFAISDIVTEKQLPDGIVCNTDLWAACIGGAAQQDSYRAMIEAAGMRLETVEDNAAYAVAFLRQAALRSNAVNGRTGVTPEVLKHGRLRSTLIHSRATTGAVPKRDMGPESRCD